MTLRAVLYVRLSRASDVSTSIRGQNDDLYATAEREGWQIVATFEDNGKSGGKTRANATAALDMLRDGSADVLAVYSYDRWSRMGIGELGDLINVIDARRDHATHSRPAALFYAARESIRSDVEGWELRAAFAADLAKRERDLMSQRRTASIARMRAEGRTPGNGPAPFGYRSAPFDDGRPGRRLVPDPAESAIVRNVANRLLQGESAVRIAASLTEAGIPTARSPYRVAQLKGDPDPDADRGTWSSVKVSTIWTSDHLTGRVRVGTSRAKGGKSNGHLLLDADGLPARPFDPIIDDDTLAALKRRFNIGAHAGEGYGSGRARMRRAARVLSGIVFCGNCGHRLYIVTDNGHPQYRCSAHSRGIRCPGRVKVYASVLEREVIGDYLSAYGRLPMVEIRERIASPASAAERADLTARIGELSTALATETDDDAAAALFAEQRKLSARRAELDALPSTVIRERVSIGGTVAEHFGRADDDGKRRMLQAAYDHVDVYRRKDAPMHDGRWLDYYATPDLDVDAAEVD
jgi:DNA invertase Pin-like site-specific DNA recombinase